MVANRLVHSPQPVAERTGKPDQTANVRTASATGTTCRKLEARMPFIPVPNTVKAELSGTINGVNWAHILHYGYSGGPPTSGQLTSGAQTLMAQWEGSLSILMSVDVTTLRAVLTDLNSSTGGQAEYLANSPGSNAGHVPSNSVTVLVSKSINRRYRGGHPRAYLPLGYEAVVATPTSWQATFVAEVATAYATFIQKTANGGMWAGVGPEVCVHRYLDNVLLATPTTDVVESYTAEAVFASQRRRIGR